MELPKLSTGQIIGGAAIVGGVAALGTAAVIIHHKRKNKRRKTSSYKNIRKTSRRSKGRKLKFGSKAYRKKYLRHGRKQKQPHTAGKRKDTSHRRIRYTKNNQPYIILSSGKARFISKKNVKSSRLRKGGKY